jgi:hypothetical protein
MKPETADALVSAIGELATTCNGLFARIMAAERVMKAQNPSLYREYQKQLSSPKPVESLSSLQQSLDRLRSKLIQSQ